MADTARQDIWEAQWDLETGNGLLCSSARRKTQGVEAYMLGEGGLDWFKQGASGAFPSGLARI